MKRILSFIIIFTMLLAGGSTAFSENSFTDVPQGAWYAKYLDVCVKEGLLQGVGNNRFAPDAMLSHAEMLTVCARLHYNLHGGEGQIPKLPAGGPSGLVYFTDTEGIKVASFNDTLGGREEFGEEDGYYLAVYFDDVTMKRLRDDEEPLDELVMVSLISGEERFKGEYCAEDAYEDICYKFFIPFDYPVDLFDELSFIANYASDEYAGKWYENTMWYWNKVFSYPMESEFEDALYELYIIADEYEQEDTTGVDYNVDEACPRIFLAAYLTHSLPRGYLSEIAETEDLPEVPDIDSELIRILYGAGIFNGVDEEGNFDAFGTLTRAQLSAVIARVIDPSLRN